MAQSKQRDQYGKMKDLAPFREDSDQEHLTTDQGLRINDEQNSSRPVSAAARCSKTSFFARRSRTLTMSAFPIESFMLGERGRTVIFRSTSR